MTAEERKCKRRCGKNVGCKWTSKECGAFLRKTAQQNCCLATDKADAVKSLCECSKILAIIRVSHIRQVNVHLSRSMH